MDAVSTDLVPAPRATAIVARSFAEAIAIATTLAESTIIPVTYRGNPANVAAVIMAGAEFGLPPMASLRLFHVIEGVPRISAAGKEAIVRDSGQLEYVKELESDDRVATYEVKRKGEAPIRRSFSWDDAVRAGLSGKDNWKKYPRNMLRWRARGHAFDDLFPDILAGLPSTDDLDPVPESFASPPIIVKPTAQDAAIVATMTGAGQGKRKKTRIVEPKPEEVIDVAPAEPEPPVNAEESAAADEPEPEPEPVRNGEPAMIVKYKSALNAARTLDDLTGILKEFRPWTETEEGKPWESTMRAAYADRRTFLVTQAMG